MKRLEKQSREQLLSRHREEVRSYLSVSLGLYNILEYQTIAVIKTQWHSGSKAFYTSDFDLNVWKDNIYCCILGFTAF